MRGARFGLLRFGISDYQMRQILVMDSVTRSKHMTEWPGPSQCSSRRGKTDGLMFLMM